MIQYLQQPRIIYALDVEAGDLTRLVAHDQRGCVMVPQLIGPGAMRAPQGVETSPIGFHLQFVPTKFPKGGGDGIDQSRRGARVGAGNLADVTLPGERREDRAGDGDRNFSSSLDLAPSLQVRHERGADGAAAAGVGFVPPFDELDESPVQIDLLPQQGGAVGVAEPAFDAQPDHRPQRQRGLRQHRANLIGGKLFGLSHAGAWRLEVGTVAGRGDDDLLIKRPAESRFDVADVPGDRRRGEVVERRAVVAERRRPQVDDATPRPNLLGEAREHANSVTVISVRDTARLGALALAVEVVIDDLAERGALVRQDRRQSPLPSGDVLLVLAQREVALGVFPPSAEGTAHTVDDGDPGAGLVRPQRERRIGFLGRCGTRKGLQVGWHVKTFTDKSLELQGDSVILSDMEQPISNPTVAGSNPAGCTAKTLIIPAGDIAGPAEKLPNKRVERGVAKCDTAWIPVHGELPLAIASWNRRTPAAPEARR